MAFKVEGKLKDIDTEGGVLDNKASEHPTFKSLVSFTKKLPTMRTHLSPTLRFRPIHNVPSSKAQRGGEREAREGSRRNASITEEM